MTGDRVNVAIEKETHQTMAQIARLLGVTVKDATDEAIRDWSRRKAPEAQKRARQVLQAAA